MMDFRQMGVKPDVIAALKKQSISEPTKVQAEVYEKIIQQKNLIVQSETGSGKTLAYLVPMLEMLRPFRAEMKAVIVVPTHELAMQVQNQIKRLRENTGLELQSVPIVGNVNIKRQIEYLKKKPQIIVGTAGRIVELMKKRKISAHTIQTIILDEADKLLEKEHQDMTLQVLKCCMRDTQLLMFSAGITKPTIEMSKTLKQDFELIRTAEEMEIPRNIKHIYLVVENRDKIETLRKLAQSINPEKAMVFVNRRFDLEESVQKLKYHKYPAECIHGSMRKQERQKVIQDFKKGNIRYLIASDLTARGMHFEDVSTVFHISIPENPIDYLHRAGRCGRNEQEGLSVLVITKEELPLVKSYQKTFGINIVAKKMFHGKIVRA